jgi:hypothetical protein
MVWPILRRFVASSISRHFIDRYSRPVFRVQTFHSQQRHRAPLLWRQRRARMLFPARPQTVVVDQNWRSIPEPRVLLSFMLQNLENANDK